MIYFFNFKTPFGPFCLGATSEGLYSLSFKAKRARRDGSAQKTPSPIRSLLRKATARVSSYLSGKRVDFQKFPIDWQSYDPYHQRILQELRKIPRGKTKSYQFLAVRSGRPRSARYVGRILHLNRLPIIIPCHRILPKGGGLGGFSQGVTWKKRLLKLECARVDKKGQNVQG